MPPHTGASASSTPADATVEHSSPPSQRRSLHAHLSPAAHDAWHDFAAGHGVTVSALLEALSISLFESSHQTMDDAVEAAVKLARSTDSKRRRRRR